MEFFAHSLFLFRKPFSKFPQSTSPPKITNPSLAIKLGPYAGRSFGSYLCTDNCYRHQAGYDHAEENGITDSDECSGNSESFI